MILLPISSLAPLPQVEMENHGCFCRDRKFSFCFYSLATHSVGQGPTSWATPQEFVRNAEPHASLQTY